MNKLNQVISDYDEYQATASDTGLTKDKELNQCSKTIKIKQKLSGRIVNKPSNNTVKINIYEFTENKEEVVIENFKSKRRKTCLTDEVSDKSSKLKSLMDILIDCDFKVTDDGIAEIYSKKHEFQAVSSKYLEMVEENDVK